MKRSLLDPLIESFDFADTDQTCPLRFVTTQPTQALGMLNSEFILKQAQVFSEYLSQSAGGSLKDQVQLALTRVMQRPPTAQEVQQGLDLIVALQKEDGLSPEQARKYFCLIALNLNEFIYLD